MLRLAQPCRLVLLSGPRPLPQHASGRGLLCWSSPARACGGPQWSRLPGRLCLRGCRCEVLGGGFGGGHRAVALGFLKTHAHRPGPLSQRVFSSGLSDKPFSTPARRAHGTSGLVFVTKSAFRDIRRPVTNWPLTSNLSSGQTACVFRPCLRR